MQRVIAGLSFIFLSIISSDFVMAADGTRGQHLNWIKKLETPAGTFPGPMDVLMEDSAPAVGTPSGTILQHRSWIRKLETANDTPEFRS